MPDKSVKLHETYSRHPKVKEAGHEKVPTGGRGDGKPIPPAGLCLGIRLGARIGSASPCRLCFRKMFQDCFNILVLPHTPTTCAYWS